MQRNAASHGSYAWVQSFQGCLHLRFVRRNANLLQRGIASAQPALPLPFLGVSSLNLGRLVFQTAPFFVQIQRRFRGCGSAL
jgi:hypothetical protein